MKDEVIPIPSDFVIHSPDVPVHNTKPNIGPDGFCWQALPETPGINPGSPAVVNIPQIDIPAIQINSVDSSTPQALVRGSNPDGSLASQEHRGSSTGEFDTNRNFENSPRTCDIQAAQNMEGTSHVSKTFYKKICETAYLRPGIKCEAPFALTSETCI